VPNLALAFEYNGEQHYRDLPIYAKNLDRQKHLDKRKDEELKEYGITLITIPYWWDKTEESLMATIHYCRPDIIYNIEAKPISTERPHKR
jgi:hypothetical protein